MIRSIDFYAVLIIVLVVYYVAPKKFQNWILLVSSLFFYGLWDVRFLGLLVMVTIVTWLISLSIVKEKEAKRKKTLLIFGICINLCVLGYFKYSGFFIENFDRLLGAFGFQITLPTLYLLLPLGVSFYTFSSISYLVDISRGTLKLPKDFLQFATYTTYFPKIIAGPIERAQKFLPFLERERHLDMDTLKIGLGLILVGLFKKVVLADPLSPFIDPVFQRPEFFSTPMLFRAVVFFTIQIYCDFSGYTDIALGVSKLLGIDLMQNFQQPYFSDNVSIFWRRWHISLSNWFRDYVYFPLERRWRSPQILRYMNILVVFLLTGLWHGASFNYIIWGCIHGFGIIFEVSPIGKLVRISPKPIRHIYLMSIVMIGWVFFKSWGVKAALNFFGNLLEMSGLHEFRTVGISILVPTMLMLVLDLFQSKAKHPIFFKDWRPIAQGLTMGVLILCIILSSGIRAPFIYGNF